MIRFSARALLHILALQGVLAITLGVLNNSFTTLINPLLIMAAGVVTIAYLCVAALRILRRRGAPDRLEGYIYRQRRPPNREGRKNSKTHHPEP